MGDVQNPRASTHMVLCLRAFLAADLTRLGPARLHSPGRYATMQLVHHVKHQVAA